MSSSDRSALAPQRDIGRQRVSGIMDAAAWVIEERGYEAATMAEIAARADARIGSLYRFFPSKEAVGDALMERYGEILAAEYAALEKRAVGVTPAELADMLIDQLVRLNPQTRAVIALLDSRTEWTDNRLRFRAQAVSGIAAALSACAPHLGARSAGDIAVVLLNNMKIMARMSAENVTPSTGAPGELRLMNRLYLQVRLAPDAHIGAP